MNAGQKLGGQLLVIAGVFLPLIGLLWGPGEWWQYLIWLAGGVTLVLLYGKHIEDKSEGPPV